MFSCFFFLLGSIILILSLKYKLVWMNSYGQSYYRIRSGSLFYCRLYNFSNYIIFQALKMVRHKFWHKMLSDPCTCISANWRKELHSRWIQSSTMWMPSLNLISFTGTMKDFLKHNESNPRHKSLSSTGTNRVGSD